MMCLINNPRRPGVLTWFGNGIGDGDLGEAQVAALQEAAQGVPKRVRGSRFNSVFIIRIGAHYLR